MRASKSLRRIVGATAVSTVAAMTFLDGGASAKAQKAGAAMRVTQIDVGGFSGVPQDKIVTISFSRPVDPKSVSPATIQVRAQNASGTGYAIEVPGSFQVAGSLVRFLPRLPTHLRDANGNFFPVGSPKDDAAANAGFLGSRNHLITVVGSPAVSPVRSTSGRPVNKSASARFTTAADTPTSGAFTTTTYQDDPPPAFQFSNPPDKVAAALDQYAVHGGTQDVPSAIDVSVFCDKVPLSPRTLRPSGNIECTLLARNEDPTFRKVVQGSPFVEQNFDTVRLVWAPRLPLPDVSTYALRITNQVLDLTEDYNFQPNAGRLRLRSMYEFLSSARSLSPTTPAAQLANPPLEVIQADWPTDAASRGVLKANLLALGDTHPDEVDPRVMVLFTTRDELVTHSSLTINFLRSEGWFDAARSTAEWDQTIAGAASAVFTAAGGSAALGDLKPTADTTISAAQFPGAVFNYRSIAIPAGVTVTFTGSPLATQPSTPGVAPVLPAASSPVTIKSLSAQIDGQISADAPAGIDASQSANFSGNAATPTPASPGGPGGGYGGYAPSGATVAGQYTSTYFASGTGGVGNGLNLVPANANDGGRGGLGGATSSGGTAYTVGSGGGGGGGGRLPGAAGGNGTQNIGFASWAGVGGAGGAGATGNADLATLVGGAGGGGGGDAEAFTTAPYYWGAPGPSGGGGGGALLVQTSGTLTMGNAGIIHARGGKGGRGVLSSPYTGGGGGGGGGGGAVLLRSSKGFNLANASAAVDVSGGAGGAANTSSFGTGGVGGAGGAGFVRFEDPNGGISVPGGSQGFYNPVGGGVPSFVYSKFIDLGVDNVKFVNFAGGDFQITSGNDAVLVELQWAVENPNALGTPLTTAIDANENSTNARQVSSWIPVRLVDTTPAGGAIKVSGNTSSDAIFPIDSKVNGFGYRFVRVRITFQLDPTQTSTSPLPFIDQMTIHYDFNF